MDTERRTVALHHSRLSLRQLMIIFMLAIVSVVVLINGWLIWSSWQRMMVSAEDEAHNLSQSLSRQAEDTFLQVDLCLQDLSERIALVGLVPAQHNYLRGLLNSRTVTLPQLGGMSILDAQGNWVVTSQGNMSMQSNNGDREYFQYHLKHDEPGVFIGKVIRSRASGELVIPVSMRLNSEDGSFRGVLLATVSLSYFKTVYGYYNLGSHNVMALMQDDGTILYIRPYSEDAINRNISDSPLFSKLLKTSYSGTAVYQSALDGIERVFGYSSLRRYPLVTVAGLDKNFLVQSWFSTISVYIALCSLLLLAVFLLGMLVMRHIGQNLKNQQQLTVVRDRLTVMNRTLQTLALIDSLTGLANRRQFDITLQHSIDRAHEQRTPLALLMIDVDNFKTFNDTYGHPQGDACLKQVADTLARQFSCHPENLVARYGGEEFAVIIPGCDRPLARKLAKEVVSAVTAQTIPHANGVEGRCIVSISAGLHVMAADDLDMTPQTLIARADTALYAAKRAGKNRVAENR